MAVTQSKKRSIQLKDLPVKKGILYLTIIAGFAGPERC